MPHEQTVYEHRRHKHRRAASASPGKKFSDRFAVGRGEVLRFRPAAAAHVEEAYDWYESRRTGLGEQFH
jgi:hypothetical protein